MRVPYGAGPDRFAELRLPEAPAPHAVVVLLHGGFWRERYRLDLMDPLAEALRADGFAAWNLEYRRGDARVTLPDVAAGLDALADAAPEHGLDLARVALVGHSAGGHLALWAASRSRVRPRLVVGLAAVADLREAARLRLGDGAVQAFLGGEPDEAPETYARAAPEPAAGQLLVHGTADEVVPPSIAERYAAHGPCELVLLDGVDHYAPIDPDSDAWQTVAERLRATLRPGR